MSDLNFQDTDIADLIYKTSMTLTFPGLFRVGRDEGFQKKLKGSEMLIESF